VVNFSFFIALSIALMSCRLIVPLPLEFNEAYFWTQEDLEKQQRDIENTLGELNDNTN
tara:strand:+ start:796 stop:969 length:174 start_codon:yes stop_codon:yes gene_type:complete